MGLKLLAAMSKQMPKGQYIDALVDTGYPELPLLVERYPDGKIVTAFGPSLDSYTEFRLGAGCREHKAPLPQDMIARAEDRFSRDSQPGGYFELSGLPGSEHKPDHETDDSHLSRP
jgi:hypothetical protein